MHSRQCAYISHITHSPHTWHTLLLLVSLQRLILCACCRWGRLAWWRQASGATSLMARSRPSSLWTPPSES